MYDDASPARYPSGEVMALSKEYAGRSWPLRPKALCEGLFSPLRLVMLVELIGREKLRDNVVLDGESSELVDGVRP